MGGGIAGWITPGWTIKETRAEPHIAQPKYVEEMLKQGENPKEYVMEECKPLCTHWKDKVTRCEVQLEKIIKVNPGKTCLYPMRDWITCVEACAQPAIHDVLKGSH